MYKKLLNCVNLIIDLLDERTIFKIEDLLVVNITLKDNRFTIIFRKKDEIQLNILAQVLHDCNGIDGDAISISVQPRIGCEYFLVAYFFIEFNELDNLVIEEEIINPLNDFTEKEIKDETRKETKNL